MPPPVRSPTPPFGAFGYYFYLKVFPFAESLHQFLEKVEQRPLLLIRSFMSPRAWNAVRESVCYWAILCGWRGSMRSGRSGTGAPFSSNPQLQPSKTVQPGPWVWTALLHTMVQNTHYWLNWGADSDGVLQARSEPRGQEIFGEKSCCRQKSDQWSLFLQRRPVCAELEVHQSFPKNYIALGYLDAGRVSLDFRRLVVFKTIYCQNDKFGSIWEN